MKKELTPPLCYIHTLLDNKEIICLLDSLAKYYSQTGEIHPAKLMVSNNEWAPIIRGGNVLGHERVDIPIALDLLVKVYVESNEVCFIYSNDTMVRVKIGADFFYYFEWEDNYYN